MKRISGKTIVVVSVFVGFLLVAAGCDKGQRSGEEGGPRQSDRIESAVSAEEQMEREYGALGNTVEELLALVGKKPTVRIILAVEYQLNKKIEVHGYRSLSEPEKRFYAVQGLLMEVNNGGFGQYFFNSAGNYASDAVAGLCEMGASSAGALLQEAMSAFPDGTPSPKRSERQSQMEQVESRSKKIWNECDDQFYRLTGPSLERQLQYVQQHKVAFSFSQSKP